MAKYVNETGLAHFWDNIKSYFGAESNPVYYGADPTGATDSSTAIAACIAANKGGSIWFMPGTYKITEPIKTPHPYEDRVSIDFNGAKIVSDVALDCFLDIGGLDVQSSGTSGRVRTFYMNGTFYGAGETETTGLTETGIKVKKYYKNAQIQNCNVLHFKKGIIVNESTGEPADTQINNCLLLWMDTSDADSAGITYNGTDNKVNDCQILGFHYTFVVNGGGIFIDNVHNYPKGFDSSNYVEKLRGSAFLLANAGVRLTRCYCDTYETFIAVNATGIDINVDNCFQYSSMTPMNMAFVKYLYAGSSTSNVRIINSSATFRPAADADATNKTIVFNASDNNSQALYRLYLQNNHLNGYANVVAGDLFATQHSNVNNYWPNNTYAKDNWLPIAVMVLPNASRCGYVDFTVEHYINGGGIYSARVAGYVAANTTNHTLDMSKVAKTVTSFVWSLGYNYVYDASQNVYYLVFYMRSTSSNITTNYSCVSNNDFNHFVSPYCGDGFHSPDSDITGLTNIDTTNVIEL